MANPVRNNDPTFCTVPCGNSSFTLLDARRHFALPECCGNGLPAIARRVPHPRGRFNETGNAAFWRAAKHAQASKAWRYFEISTNHVMASNMPEETARLLMAAGKDAARATGDYLPSAP